MSYTVVLDQQQIAFERANTWNAIVRHCKIGKVTRKYRAPQSLKDALAEYEKAIRWPLMQNDLGRYLVGERKCSCLPGQACGNAACPHGLRAN